jgi:hypothetical protein
VKHFGKMIGVRTRACSKCGGDLADRYGKHCYCKACHAANMRANRRKHSDLNDEQRKKANVRSLSKHYLQQGLIKWQPCVACGSEESEMHHESYDRPMDVTWLCRPCHLKEHKTPSQKSSEEQQLRKEAQYLLNKLKANPRYFTVKDHARVDYIESKLKEDRSPS